MVRFEKALMLAKSLGDKVKERRAVRGLAASCRMQGQLRQVGAAWARRGCCCCFGRVACRMQRAVAGRSGAG